MIKLHTNSNYKKLYVHLLRLLIDSDSVFSETWIVVPNHSAKQWLQKSLARDFGVCAQIKFILPLSFNWEILKNVAQSDGKINVFSTDVLRWHIYHLITEDDEFLPFKKQSAIENFNLSEKIAQTLLKYNEERPALINDWDNGVFQLKKDQLWQANMWLKLLVILKEQSPVQLLQKFNPVIDFKQKPDKIILFATEQLTVIQKEVMVKLGAFQDIYILLSNPSPNDYWFDIKPEGKIARDKLFNTELAYLNNVGNPLLANLAYSKMAIFDAFLNQDIDFTAENQRDIEDNSLLDSVKSDISELLETPKAHVSDDSITVHSCHNRLREVEIIKDEMLGVLNENLEINPEDMIVVAPDINDYVYAIKQVFDHKNSPLTHHIPFHIDRVRLADNNYITSLMQLLNSFTGEMMASVIYELLSQNVILAKFHLSEDDLPRIKHWIIESNVRNFYSDLHKDDLGFEKKIGNTWQFGEKRWLAGYLAGEVDDMAYLSTFGDITGQENIFSQCFQFLKLWYHFYIRSKQEQTPQQWYIFIKEVCVAFLYNDYDIDCEKLISQQLEHKLIQQTLNCKPEVSLKIINNIVDSVITENNYRSEGQIGVRFQTWENAFIADAKVLFILGINDGEFPSKEIKNDLDLFNNASVRLNKSTRQRDKNLLLTALTENVEKLIITYMGFDPKTNEPQPPSALLDDVLSYLQIKTDHAFHVISHNMHGYNKRYFSDKFTSYSQKHHQLASSFYNKHQRAEPEQIALKLDCEYDIKLNSLSQFFVDPLNDFLKKRVQINLPINEEIIQDTETYYPTGLESWKLKQQIFQHGQSSAEKTGIISDNNSGQSLLKKNQNDLKPLIDKVNQLDLQSHAVERILGDYTIFGVIEKDAKHHLTSVFPNKARGKDVAKHWIKHLCYQSEKASYMYFEDKVIQCEPIKNSDELLAQLLSKWQQSFNHPWLFCPASYIKITTKKCDIKTKKDYLNSFIHTENSFPSEGQKYFFNHVSSYDEHNDIEQILLPLINSLVFI